MPEDQKDISRRELLKAGAVVAGVLAAGGVLGNNSMEMVSKAFAANKATWPFPYKKLDPGVVRKVAYESFYASGSCAYGAANGILSELQRTVGGPFDGIPADMFRYGAGGVAGWGSLCGAINGSATMINLVVPQPEFGALIGELVGWYTQNPFPSKVYDTYAKFKDQPQKVIGSPDCHVSVAEWCKVAGVKPSDPELVDRCAKVSGDTAAKAVELLNAWADKKFVPLYKPTEEFAGCIGCHVGPTSTLNNVFGQENCVQCHKPHNK